MGRGTLPPACSARSRRPYFSMVGIGHGQHRVRAAGQLRELRRRECPPGAVRHDQHPRVAERLVPGGKLEHVAGELLELRVVKLDQLAAARAQLLEHPRAVGARDRPRCR